MYELALLIKDSLFFHSFSSHHVQAGIILAEIGLRCNSSLILQMTLGQSYLMSYKTECGQSEPISTYSVPFRLNFSLCFLFPWKLQGLSPISTEIQVYGRSSPGSWNFLKNYNPHSFGFCLLTHKVDTHQGQEVCYEVQNCFTQLLHSNTFFTCSLILKISVKINSSFLNLYFLNIVSYYKVL